MHRSVTNIDICTDIVKKNFLDRVLVELHRSDTVICIGTDI